MKYLLLTIFFAAVPALPGLCAFAAPVELRVAAAADLKFAMEDLAKSYSATHKGQTITPIYGSSGSFVTQITQGAPLDLFFSADTASPERLEKDGKVEGAVFPYTVGHIVLWVPNASKLDLSKGLNVLLLPEVKKIAIGNPAHAPYGRAAKEALEKSGLWEKILPKIVMGENIAQAAQFAESGAADIGILALSLAVSPTLKKEGRFQAVDDSLYAKMVQSGVVLKSSKHSKEAQNFRDFVLSADGQKILAAYGLPSKK